MNIIMMTEGLTAKEKYALSYNQGINKMSDHVGERITIDKFMMYEDEDEDGIRTILSILAENGQVYATNSPTFIRDFTRIVEMFTADDEELPEILIYGGTSKNDREFIACSVAM